MIAGDILVWNANRPSFLCSLSARAGTSLLFSEVDFRRRPASGGRWPPVLLVLSPSLDCSPATSTTLKPKMSSPHTTHPIHLAPLHPSERTAGSPSLSTKNSQDVIHLPQKRAAPRWAKPTLAQAERVLWAAVPLVLHIIGLVLLVAALVQKELPYMKVRQVAGSGKMDFNILGELARRCCW